MGSGGKTCREERFVGVGWGDGSEVEHRGEGVPRTELATGKWRKHAAAMRCGAWAVVCALIHRLVPFRVAMLPWACLPNPAGCNSGLLHCCVDSPSRFCSALGCHDGLNLKVPHINIDLHFKSPCPSQAAMMAYSALCDTLGRTVEPYVAPMLPVFLERLADKVRGQGEWGEDG